MEENECDCEPGARVRQAGRQGPRAAVSAPGTGQDSHPDLPLNRRRLQTGPSNLSAPRSFFREMGIMVV